MKENNIVGEKAYEFAKNIIIVSNELVNQRKEYVLSKQLLRSGTSVCANIIEAQRGQSRRNFIAKMNIALKEANETEYWLRLLTDTNYLNKEKGQFLLIKCRELCKLLYSIVNTTKTKKLW